MPIKFMNSSRIDGYTFIRIDPYDGITMENNIDTQGTVGSEVNYVTLDQGWLFLKGGLSFDIDAFPTSPKAAGLMKGDVYRSGDTLKIKTTD